LLDRQIGRLLALVHLNYCETVLPIRDGLLKLKDFPPRQGDAQMAFVAGAEFGMFIPNRVSPSRPRASNRGRERR